LGNQNHFREKNMKAIASLGRVGLVATVALGLGSFASRGVADVELVENGKPVATIVVAQDVFENPFKGEPDLVGAITEQTRVYKVSAAANELQAYLEKMTGAKVPIVSGDGGAAISGNVILVGKSAATKAHDAKIPAGVTSKREEEGYLILAKGNTLVLAGNDDGPYHGTEYAVADFLRSQGVRWYMPGEFGEVVPKKKTVEVQDQELRGKPDFKMRNYWGPMSPEMVKLAHRFKIRNGLNPMTHFIALPADSSIRNVIPPQDKLDAPEFAEVWGKDANGKNNHGMPNLTSEKSVAYAAEKIKDWFRKNPKSDSYGLGGDDGYPRDYSPNTVARNLNFPDVGGRAGVVGDLSTTEEWMDWVNKVAAEVHKEFPNHAITTNGYANRNTPAQGVKFDPEIWVMFAAIWSDTLHAYDNPRSWMTLRQGEMIRQWAQQSKHVYMYNYTYYMLASAGAPIPLTRKHEHDMPLYKKWGVVGFSNEGRYACGEQGVFANYLMFRQMWEANLDAKKLADEFYRDWYGSAAKPARAFWNELEETMETTPMVGHEDRIMPYVYSPELMKRLEKHLKDAEKAADNEWSRVRVRADRLIYEHLRGFLAMHEAEFKGDFVEAVKQADYMAEQRKQLAAISSGFFDINKETGEAWGFYYWGVAARKAYYQQMADLTTGKTGEMITVLPEEAEFAIDPRDEGRFFEWYKPEFKTKGWHKIKTTAPFYTQEDRRKEAPKGEFASVPYRDSQGYTYMGATWYRIHTSVPASAKGKKVMLYAPALETEAWVWVNGKFVGHRPYIDAYVRPNPLDIDVTDAIKPGEENAIVLRVHTSLNPAQTGAAMTSRLFLYSPK